MDGNTLVKFDADCRKVGSKAFRRPGAVAGDGRHVFVSAEGAFVALDADLKELSRVPLLPNKDAHDILVHGQTAYLLDNIMRPLWVFQVDVSDPGQVRLAGKLQFRDAKTHLRAQWLEPRLGRWFVLKNMSIRAGAFQMALVFPMPPGQLTEPFPHYGTWKRGRGRDAPQEGTRILAATGLPPVWAVVRQATDGKIYLAQVHGKPDGVSFSPAAVLEFGEGDPVRDPPIIRRCGSYLCVSQRGGRQIELFHTSRRPVPTVKLDLKGQGIERILDVLPVSP